MGITSGMGAVEMVVGEVLLLIDEVSRVVGRGG